MTYCLYTCRRTFCRRWAERGGDVQQLARLIGHRPGSIALLEKHYYSPSAHQVRKTHGLLGLDDFHLGVAPGA
jgi:hypothetical protein